MVEFSKNLLDRKIGVAREAGLSWDAITIEFCSHFDLLNATTKGAPLRKEYEGYLDWYTKLRDTVGQAISESFDEDAKLGPHGRTDRFRKPDKYGSLYVSAAIAVCPGEQPLEVRISDHLPSRHNVFSDGLSVSIGDWWFNATSRVNCDCDIQGAASTITGLAVELAVTLASRSRLRSLKDEFVAKMLAALLHIDPRATLSKCGRIISVNNIKYVYVSSVKPITPIEVPSRLSSDLRKGLLEAFDTPIKVAIGNQWDGASYIVNIEEDIESIIASILK